MSDASNADSSNVGSFQSIGHASHASTNLSTDADAPSAQDQDDISSVSSQGVVPFALSPALVSNAIIDYRTVSGSKLFKGATTALATDPLQWRTRVSPTLPRTAPGSRHDLRMGAHP